MVLFIFKEDRGSIYFLGSLKFFVDFLETLR